MQKIIWSEVPANGREEALARPAVRQSEEVLSFVRTLFNQVQSDGPEAIAHWAGKLDRFPPRHLHLSERVIERARSIITDEDYEALIAAKRNIEQFHKNEPIASYNADITNGVICERVFRPLETAGLYVPGGSAPLFSTLLMLAVPAAVADVKNIILCTPPDKDGEAHPLIILAAHACGLDNLYILGGAQAVAAMAMGAGEIPKADIIAGPGNAYVTAAKTYAASLPNGPVIDMPAGPSELLIIADEAADPSVVAADLLSQAEHDEMAQVILVSTGETLIAAVEEEVVDQLSSLPRKDIAEAALANAKLILVSSVEEAVEISNRYAPEHLSLNLKDADGVVSSINTAGTVFVGPWSAETFGDYVAGPSHVLPTDGAARAWSGVSVATFLRSMTVQRTSRGGAESLAPIAARLARLEGLEAHARAADARLRNMVEPVS